MKLNFLTMAEISRLPVECASDALSEPSARRGYFDRISQVFERGVLIFVVLLALLGNYVNHGILMSDSLIY